MTAPAAGSDAEMKVKAPLFGGVSLSWSRKALALPPPAATVALVSVTVSPLLSAASLINKRFFELLRAPGDGYHAQQVGK